MTQSPQVYSKYELIFTPHLIPTLSNLRGTGWQELIDQLSQLSETHPDTLAFSMMMIELGNCLACDMDSYRAQRGCSFCAKQSVLSYKGTDKQLLRRFERTKSKIKPKLADLAPIIPLKVA